MKKIKNILIGIVGLVISYSAVGAMEYKGSEQEVPLDMAEQQVLLDIAMECVKKKFPGSVVITHGTGYVLNNGDLWIVTYSLEDPSEDTVWIGGVPSIFINKSTLKIVKAISSQ